MEKSHYGLPLRGPTAVKNKTQGNEYSFCHKCLKFVTSINVFNIRFTVSLSC